MTLQYTEHPTPKIWLLVDAPDKGQKFYADTYHKLISKCERIEVVNFYDTELKRSMYDFFNYGKGKALKDGDTFEIDDEKVSVEIGYKPQCDKSCCDACLVYGCDEQHFKIATLKLKETVKKANTIRAIAFAEYSKEIIKAILKLKK